VVFRSATSVGRALRASEGRIACGCAWLLEKGDLARALAAAVLDMATKGYLQIEQRGELYSITQLGPGASVSLEPEEDALARTLSLRWMHFHAH
jgi:hypothetical protein